MSVRNDNGNNYASIHARCGLHINLSPWYSFQLVSPTCRLTASTIDKLGSVTNLVVEIVGLNEDLDLVTFPPPFDTNIFRMHPFPTCTYCRTTSSDALKKLFSSDILISIFCIILLIHNPFESHLFLAWGNYIIRVWFASAWMFRVTRISSVRMATSVLTWIYPLFLLKLLNYFSSMLV